jgi:hypothetical protein
MLEAAEELPPDGLRVAPEGQRHPMVTKQASGSAKIDPLIA